jgi:2-polyprenyl-6-methoxyphenol hydroxylase-like FAD-dependent oxidoreductase
MPETLARLPEGSTFDVVVAGAGGAGMAAALFAAIRGLKVLLVESTGQVGGTTALSAGSAWIPNTRHARALGAEDDLEKAATYLRHASRGQSSETMRRAFLRLGPEAVECLESHTQVRFRARALHPDYNTELEGSTLRGRVLEALPFEGERLGEDIGLVRPPLPEFTILGGLMVNQEDVLHLLRIRRSGAALRHAASLLLDYLGDLARYRRSMRLMMGNALVGRLLLSLRERGVPLLMNSRIRQIERDAGGVCAVVLEQGAQSRRIGIGRGLIVATGGFNRDPARRAALLPDPPPPHCPGAPGHTGALHPLLEALGAHYGPSRPDNAFWAPVSVRKRADGTMAVFPHFMLDRGRPGVIAVDAAGRRFVNEAVSYHPFVQGMYAAQARPGGAAAIPAFLITDAEGLRRYGLGMARPGSRPPRALLADGYLTRAATLRGLAQALGIDAAGLEATVVRMNAFAQSGVDADFGRGSTDYQRITAGDPSHGPNPCLGPVRTPPFYAIRLYPGDIGAATGFLTDERARVLDAQGQPIGRLYACGNDMHSVMGGQYPGPGITIGPGLAFAYAAALDAAGPETSPQMPS